MQVPDVYISPFTWRGSTFLSSLLIKPRKGHLFFSNLWIFIPVLLLGLGYCFSLELHYVEGDDSSSVIYHAMGRNDSLQSPYSSYNALADVVLDILPSNESILRMTSMLLSAAANVAVVILMTQLVFDWLCISDVRTKILMALMILVGVPEFFYIGLVYTPTLFAMVLLLACHLLLHRVNFSEPAKKDRYLILASIILFALGAAFRWDTVTYGAVIVCDLALFTNVRPVKIRRWRQRVMTGLVWGAAALSTWFLTLFLLGFSPADVLDVSMTQLARQPTRELTATPPSTFGLQGWLSGFSPQTFASVQTLLSPLIILLFAVGFLILVRRRSALLGIVAISTAVIFPWLPIGVPKLFMVAIPIILATSAIGLKAILDIQSQGLRRLALAGIVVIGLLPWFVGVQVRWGDTAWGPGFELQDFDRPIHESNSYRLVLFGGGAAVPTSEGPRALFGHFAALFGGQWRNLIWEQDEDIRNAVFTAYKHNLPLYVFDTSDSYYVADLLRKGFTTDDSEAAQERIFTRADGQTMTLKEPHVDPLAVFKTPQGTPASFQAVIVGDPSTLRRLYLAMPDDLERIGSTTAIFHPEGHQAKAQ